jgi:hypothetical protein
MIDVLEIVASIEAEKESKNVFPTHALLPEIMIKVKSEVKDELNRLVSEGKLGWCETLNTYGFSIIKDK